MTRRSSTPETESKSFLIPDEPRVIKKMFSFLPRVALMTAHESRHGLDKTCCPSFRRHCVIDKVFHWEWDRTGLFPRVLFSSSSPAATEPKSTSQLYTQVLVRFLQDPVCCPSMAKSPFLFIFLILFLMCFQAIIQRRSNQKVEPKDEKRTVSIS